MGLGRFLFHEAGSQENPFMCHSFMCHFGALMHRSRYIACLVLSVPFVSSGAASSSEPQTSVRGSRYCCGCVVSLSGARRAKSTCEAPVIVQLRATIKACAPMLCVVFFLLGPPCCTGWAQCHDSVSFCFAVVATCSMHRSRHIACLVLPVFVKSSVAASSREPQTSV